MHDNQQNLLNEFLLCINEKRYYDAHEALEQIWYPRRFEQDDEIYLLKGFINASVCFELIKRGRIEPSKTAWKTYLKYRSLLYKVQSPFLNQYHFLARAIENKYHSKTV